MPTRHLILLAAASVFVGACSSSSAPTACPDILGTALDLTVRDAATQAALAANATATAQIATIRGTETVTGQVVDSLHIAILGPAGTYDILVRENGYAAYVKNGIVVPTGASGCGVQKQSIAVAMQPPA